MKLNFTYNKDKDIWCLLNKDKSSNNSQASTEQYQQLINKYGENPTAENTAIFVDEYITENNIDIEKYIKNFQKDWENISTVFQKNAEAIFNVSLPTDVIVYLTINSRCPYSIQDKFFYVSLQSSQATKTIMHELWHFYTWYGLGIYQEEKLGKQKYNDIKEALTVLLNVECKDLFPEGVIDIGYPQHQETRQLILNYWEKNKDIKRLWEYLVSSPTEPTF
ncbi:MAG: hypothetical protein KBD55_00480 [Candidatus Pacebacteria bacterium]|nr:hypothetical protein [Candidatus Paceibacterota bacterium]